MVAKKIFEHIVNPKKCIKYLGDKLLYSPYGRKMDDEKYLKTLFKFRMGYALDLKNPKTFNEKIQWLKLYNRNPEYTRIVDKYEFKSYIAEKLGAEYVIPTIGKWDKFEDIDFDVLPDKFVLKCNHDSGGLVICKDKSKLDIDAARKKINACLKQNYYYTAREWPYKDVKPCIIAEEYLDLPDGLTEYKLFSFNGRAEIVLVCKGVAHTSNRTNTFFDRDFNRLPIQNVLPNQKEDEQKPPEYEQLLSIADKLSEGIPQVRVDFYIFKGQVYVGEMTFFHNTGMCKFTPRGWDEKLGELIKLPNEKC